MAIPIDVVEGEVYTWVVYNGERLQGYVCTNDCYSGGNALSGTGWDHGFEVYVATCSE